MAYAIMLALFSSQGVPDDITTNTRGTIYVTLAAGVGVGKSRVMDKALRSFWNGHGLLLRDDPRRVKRFIPSSAPGFQDRLTLPVLEGQKPLVDEEGRPLMVNNCLIHCNEMHALLNNLKIQYSNLPDMLTDLWDGNTFETGTGKQLRYTNAHISFMGAVPAADTDAFSAQFTAVMMQGLFDRLIVVPQAEPWDFDDNWQPTPCARDPWPVTIPPEVMTAFGDWRRAVIADALKDDPDSEVVRMMPRISENARRVALISASANHEHIMSMECMQHAIRFGNYQVMVKTDFNASAAENDDAKAGMILVRAMEKLVARDIKRFGDVDGAKRYYSYSYLMSAGNIRRANDNMGTKIFAAAWDAKVRMNLFELEPAEELKDDGNGAQVFTPIPGKFTKRARLYRPDYTSETCSQLVADDE
jgi:hypothetical protein